MSNVHTYRGHIVAIHKIELSNLNRAKSIGGNCETCNKSVVDIENNTRCKLKKLKVVNRYALCHCFEETPYV